MKTQTQSQYLTNDRRGAVCHSAWLEVILGECLTKICSTAFYGLTALKLLESKLFKRKLGFAKDLFFFYKCIIKKADV